MHSCPHLISCAQTHIHLGAHLSLALSEAIPFTHGQSAPLFSTSRSASTYPSYYILEIWLILTHTCTPVPTLACLQKHVVTPRGAFLFHTYRSVSLTRMLRYTQLAYLLHQCGTSLLSGDCRIADCTVTYTYITLYWERLHFLDLHRQERVHLACLRCGHNLALRSYENRRRPEVDPECRWCGDITAFGHIAPVF